MNGRPQDQPSAFDSWWVRAGAVLAAWFLLLVTENLAVSILFGQEFAGAWETRATRRYALPLALAALTPASFVCVGIATLAAVRREAFASIVGALGALTAWGVSSGRHMTSLVVRIPFVAAVAVAGAALAWRLAPTFVRLGRTRPGALAAFGCGASVAVALTDARILPRLYPAFHVAMLGTLLAAAALLALVLRPRPGDPTRAPRVVAGIALAAGALALAFAPAAARALASSDNVRLTLLEHAPVEGRAVLLGALLAPPAPADVPPASASFTPPGELPRALDWTGRDIVLLTVDALRADHVSAYGYTRPTTPGLDALARDGARFDAAYCPTPHTSYSIASLMTGKYMRPLVAMGLGADSDTWASILRRYGYHTAAFFPPAVFFIDGERFEALHARGLDFEYRKEEFASPELRARQVAEYLAATPRDRPLFLWVHFFEPHEPYVAHPEHPFGAGDVDRYDSEIAAADDGIRSIVAEVRATRPGAVVLATADHGEEFGEHGGRYHGTTVYEEQVRVPLVIDAPGVAAGAISSVVQTIDLLPTVLSALGIPRPARLRGRDLGPLLAPDPRAPHAPDPGLAFAETDEYTLLARGDARLVCARRVSACALYDRATDPGETRDVSRDRAAEAAELRRVLSTVASQHGALEHGEEAQWPEALRRGIAGDADAAADVAALLDDASARIRERAAEVLFDLKPPSVAPAMRRALAQARGDADPVGRWSALALVRVGEPPSPRAQALAHDPDPAWRRVAALAFAEQGDARGAADLADAWADRASMSFVRATDVVSAVAKIRDRQAVAALVASLSDVRYRVLVSDALAAIGDPSARAPLMQTLATETQTTARDHEERAVAALGGASSPRR
jgi:HEAT repeat protein